MAHDTIAKTPVPAENAEQRFRRSIFELAQKSGLRRCYDCGKCTSVCPINLGGRFYSPRRLGQQALDGAESSLQDALWDCLTCCACRELCPTNVDFPDFVRQARIILPVDGPTRECSHGGAIQTIMRLMTDTSRELRRLDWVPPGVTFSHEGEILFFTGSAPYFDQYFNYLAINTLEGPRAALKILNLLDINPVLLPQERSSGHDLLFSGDEEGFLRLAQLNYDQMKEAGVKRVVTTCAESFYTMSTFYPRYLPGFNIEVHHFLPFLESHLETGKVEFRPVKATVTYHDPCRLGRMSGVIESPRRLLERIPGLELVEMRRHGNKALCCGTSAWIRCGAHSKRIQNERLSEAAATGSDLLATTCPKCIIHFTCAQADLPEGDSRRIGVVDLAALLVKSLRPAEESELAKGLKQMNDQVPVVDD